MGVFKVEHGYTHRGQGCVNIYHYVEAVGIIGTAEELATAFTDLCVPTVANLQHVGATHDFVRATNLEFLSNDTYTIDLSFVAGNRTGGDMPPHDAIKFQLLVDSSVTRIGTKAIGGVPEAEYDSELPNANQVGRHDLYIVAVSTVLENSLGIPFYIPVVYRENLILPDVINAIKSARYARIATQTSRRSYSSTSTGSGNLVPDAVVALDGQNDIIATGVWKLGKPYSALNYPNEVLPAQWTGSKGDSLVLPELN